MTAMEWRDWLAAAHRVLDGGFATELERQGAQIDGPLWSAHVLEDEPECIVAVHQAYVGAGADCILTSSYQVSRRGYLEYGLTAEDADRALVRSVSLARLAVAGTDVRVACSLGPYGAALHDGSEYHGNYSCSASQLVAFHREKLAVLSAAADHGDVIAFETLPSLAEAEAVLAALADFPQIAVWLSFTCKDQAHLAHGEQLADAARLVAGNPQVAALGINCTAPRFIAPLAACVRQVASELPILVYPNSGEEWDAVARGWCGRGDALSFAEAAQGWFTAGVAMVGGCCRTTPAHIRAVADVRSLI